MVHSFIQSRNCQHAPNRRYLRHRHLVGILIIAFTVELMFPSAATVHAQGADSVRSNESYWGSSYIEADFSKHTLDVKLWMYIGMETPGSADQQIVDAAEPINLDCRPIGQPYFANGYLMLDGNSYLECAVPNTQEYFEQFTEVVGIFDGCECELGRSTFWTSADINLPPQSGNGTWPVYAIDFQGSKTNPAGEGDQSLFLYDVGEIKTGLRLDQNSNLGHHWNLDPDGNKVWIGNGGGYYHNITDQTGWSSFMHTLQQNADAQATLMDPATSEAFYEWAENAGGDPLFDPVVREVASQDRVFSTSEATLTIGYDPVTGTYFEGGIRAFDSDPGCKPN